MRKTVSCLLALCALAFSAHVPAQAYPVKPIRLIVPFPPGGPTDTHSRWAGQQLNVAFGQPVVVENRAGAAGIIGTEVAAKAPADGYTLLGGNPGPLTIAPGIRKQLGYDPVRDFAPITLIARNASAWCVHPSVPVKNLKDFVAFAKARPGKINFATPGVGTVGHLAIEYLATATGIKMNHVPYKGAALYTVDLLAGNMDFAQIQIFQAAPYVKAGKLKALGVTSLERSPLLPDIATAHEQGVKGYTSYNWNGVLAPAGTLGCTHQALALRAMSVIGAKSLTGSYASCLRMPGAMVSGPGLPPSRV